MNEKNSNFIITDDKDVRKTLMSWNLLEIHNNDGMYVFVNEPKKLQANFEKLNIEFEREKRFEDCKDVNTLPFDTYIKSLNLVIEFDGSQHFKPSFGNDAFGSIIYHDTIKNAYCEDNNINILRIPFWEFRNMEEIIKKKIDELIKTFDGQVS